jgi:hypothetical protein
VAPLADLPGGGDECQQRGDERADDRHRRDERIPGFHRPETGRARRRQARLGRAPRRWIVTFAHESVVTARSAGLAVAAAYESGTPGGAPRRTVLYNVRPTAARRRNQRVGARTSKPS